MEFRVLGRPDVYYEGESLDIGTPKQRTVLGALLLSTNEALSTERLMDSVWWQPPAAAGANLRLYLAGLRRVLQVPGEGGSRLCTVRAGGYQINVYPGELDLERFDRLADEGERALRAGRLPAAADCLERALRLWRGRALDGVAYGPALQATVLRLEERRLAVAEQWAQARLALGQPESVVSELRALVKEHPLRERLCVHLMVALCRAGRPGEALAAYAELCALLASELGADPGPELRRLHERILRGDDSLASGTSSGQAVPAAPPRQLPAGSTELCGRADELAWLARTLRGAGVGDGPVVIAVDGVAGVGKSALALKVARECASWFPDGQVYVDLRGATPGLEPLRPVEVLGRFLRTFGVRPSAVPDDEAEAAALFRSVVAQHRVLVLLDDAASLAQVRPLLPGGAGCAAVVTSRRVLTGLAEAVRLPLDLLSPGHAVSLLEQLAGTPRVRADPAGAARLAALCGHLPLALRIAGARLAARPGSPVAELADRLAAAQHRLDELAVADLAVRASLDLTYRGLTERARLALRRLGPLRTRDFPSWALAALLDAPLSQADQVLDDLVAVHLVEPVAAADQTRYRLHDLVRAFAQEQASAGDEPSARTAATRRLVGAALALAERADTRLSADFLGLARHRLARWSLPRAEVDRITADPRSWFEREHDLLMSVVDDGLAVGATGLAGSLAAALTTFFQLGTHFDDWRRVQSRALAAALRAGDRRTAVKLYRGLGELETIQDRYPEAIGHFEAARAAITNHDPEYEAAITAGLGYLYRLRGQSSAALDTFGRARELALRTDNLNGRVYATNGIGVVHLERGRLAEATAYFDECLRLSRQAGYRPGEAQALRSLGHVARADHRYADAADYFRRAQQISENLGDRLAAAHAACWLGETRVRLGRPGEGRRLLARCLWVHRDFANAWGEAGTLWALAVAQLAAGRPRLGLHRAGQAVAIWRRIGSPHWLATGLRVLAEAHDALGDPVAAEQARREAAELRQQLDES
ncbi:BTAD domain-containing putative transcriptional regulator [Plantactinospora mayteni]|uniref:SARP family transcriptional regulator n=1 Tax=Plantactinospora mayteni TaxID=566021 RepID=A0ABQ4EFW1_9ACTN|nr:SARP family transcriptional regulator [Plantactinospora mayteni]